MTETADTDYATDYDTDHKMPIMTDIWSENFLINLKITNQLLHVSDDRF